MTDINGADNIWIRTTSPGLLPYEDGMTGNGHGNVGTMYWAFKEGWFDTINGGTPITSNGGAIEGVIKSKTSDGCSRTSIILLPRIPFQLLDPTHTDNIYFREYLKWICTNYPNQATTIFFGSVNPNSSGIAVVYIYDTNNVSSEGLPQYSTGIYLTLANGLKYFTTNNYNYEFK